MSTPRSRPDSTVPKPKLLVVDDEPDNLDLLYRTFYRQFQVLRAETGPSALDILAQQSDIAVIISDQRMPGMSGTELLSRAAIQFPDIMRIILTGYTDVEDLVEAINEGKVFKYVTKPWDDEELKAIVHQALEAHKLIKARTADLNRVLRQKTLLNAITTTIRSAQTSQQMMQTIVDTIGESMDVSYCVLKPFYDDALKDSCFIYQNPSLTEGLSVWEESLLTETLWSSQDVLVMEPVQASLAEHVPEQAERLAVFEMLRIEAAILIPLLYKKDLMAVLGLHQQTPARPWDTEEIKLLKTLADQAALALAQAYTYERVQALAQREVLINTITTSIRSSLNPQETFSAITLQLGQALKVDGCALSLWSQYDDYVECVGLYDVDQDQAHLATDISRGDRPLPKSQTPIAGNPVLKQLLETQEPVVLNNLDTHPNWVSHDLSLKKPAKALLVVPLIADGDIIGSISLRQIDRARYWSPDEVDLAQVVASQAAIAVQQARLYQTTLQQSEKLLALDRQKTEFFQNISHEFRTPLTLTIGPLETVVSAGEGLDYEQSQVALRNSRRLLRLVNQLLDIQRLDAGRMQSVFRRCDPVKFVQEIIEAFSPYCDRKSLHLSANLQPCPPLYLDLEKFDKVLYNLLSNAIKFTEPGGEITVRLNSDGAVCRIQVCDTGIGIRPDQIEYLFERFRQADGSSNRKFEGTGLGLALVKALVELHNGTINVDSTYGQGSVFTVTVPVGKRHLSPNQIRAEDATVEQQRAAVELADIEHHHREASMETSVGASSNSPCVLIVDDNADMRVYVASVLRREGYQIYMATDGAEGYQVARKVRPDLILTDWMMPNVTGVELLQLIRADAVLNSVPIVLLTAKVDDETRITGVEQGADAYLGKPFNDRELLAEVRNLLALKANERRVAELNQYLTESVLGRFLPKPLVLKAAKGELQLDLQPEPRVVTILFTDIVGFTQLSNKLGPKGVAELLNKYLDRMTSAIFEYRGTVDKFMGDGLLALFGAPEDLSPEEQVKRAIGSVHRMHEYLKELNQYWRVQGIPAVEFRCGIHQGNAVVGMFGSAERTDFTAIGPSVNMASRLQEAAQPNAILVSEEVVQYLDPSMILDSQSLNLKGIEGPVTALSIRSEVASVPAASQKSSA